LCGDKARVTSPPGPLSKGEGGCFGVDDKKDVTPKERGWLF